LSAAQNVALQRPRWHLVLVGDGPCRARLLDQLNANPLLRERTRWLGRRDDVSALLKASDVLVHPSLWEGMPNVVLEAMAANRPVVGTAVEGTEDLVIPGETGWLVPTHDTKALSQALIQAADSPETCRRFGIAGGLRVEMEFSLDRTVAAYER